MGRALMGQGKRGTVTFVCRNADCDDYGQRYSVATIADQFATYTDGETACPACKEEGEELD